MKDIKYPEERREDETKRLLKLKFHPVHIDMKVNLDGTGEIKIVDDREMAAKCPK